MSKPPVLDLAGIVRRYGEELTILDGADLTVAPGEMVGLLGPSGSGKSSLLHIAGLLEKPTAGRVVIDGQDTTDLGDRGLTALRRDKIGFVYQFHHLLPEFTALRNAAFPRLIAGEAAGKAMTRATELLTTLGLGERLDHQPAQLSGGEKQRVAIARALANDPSLLLADEPTGNLDVDTSATVFGNLVELVRSRGVGAIIATHDRGLAAQMDRVVVIESKKLVEREVAPAA